MHGQHPVAGQSNTIEDGKSLLEREGSKALPVALRRCLYFVNRIRPTGLMAIVACLFLLLACRLGQQKAPSISIDSLEAKAGLALRVVGKNWHPGEQVTIGLAAPNSQPRDSQTMTTVLTDAAGQFVALFRLPVDQPWNHMAEIWVVAHSRDFGKVAVASFSHTPLWTTTPIPGPAPPATPSMPPAVHVLGYVENIIASTNIIKLQPIEGQAEIVAWTQNTQIIRQGQPVRITDIHIGDLIEASGQFTQDANNSIIAESIYILIRATAQPTATPTATLSAIVWQGEYYNNTTFSGSPALTREDLTIDFQWQGGAAAGGLPTDNFAVRWTGNWPFERGAYRFHAQVDDGVRLWLDDHLIIDQWHQSTGALYSTDAYLSGGSHRVRAEYFDGQGNAQARIWWDYRGSDAVQTYPDWKGEYFSNMLLDGGPFLAVNERLIDFNWAEGVPAVGMPADNFSVRWAITATVEAGIYRFYARTDDGVRVWVDDAAVIDHWEDGAAETYSGEAYLPGGEHKIRVEYYEHTGLAVIKVWWELLPATPTPTSTWTPTCTPTHTATHTPALPTPTNTQTPMPTPEDTPVKPELTRQPTLTPQSGSLFAVYLPQAPGSLPRHVVLRRAPGKRWGGRVVDW